MVADSRNFAKQVIEMLESSEFTDTPFVLIVEDSPTIAGILKRAFQSKGYRADIALNTRDAAKYFSNTKYDVAIIDYHLPDNMGDILLDSFHNQNLNCVYLMMTNDPKPELALDWIKRGASAYIRKPFEPEYLIELCTKARRERSLLLVEDLLELRTQELKASEEKYYTLFNEMLNGFALHEIICDQNSTPIDYRFLAVNPAFERMTGFKAEDVIGRRILEVLPLIEKYWIETYGKVALTGEPALFDNYSAQIDKYFEVTAFRPAKNQFACIFTDITERKKAEDALKLSREQFELAVNGSNDGIWDWNLRDNALYISPKWKEQLGYEDNELVNEYNTFENNLHPDDKPAVIDYVQRYLKGEFEKYSIEFRMKHKDGTYRWILARGAAIRDDSGATFRMAGSHTDITERKEAEIEKERLQTQLTQSQKLESIGRLAGGVAHDLNNMLSVILGNTDMAMDNLDPSAPIFDELKEIKDAAQRSANLTRQLLAFARKQTITPTVLDLNETVEEMLKMLRRIIGEDIDLKWQPQNSLWSIKMDTSQIDQILANLFVNSRDAISGVGNLTIKTQNVVLNENGYTGNSCCRDQKESCYPICYIDNPIDNSIDNPQVSNSHYVLLSVSDDGCGMDSNTLKNIFEPFFTTKEVGKGTGLGLATVYGIVKQNRGFIDVQSQLGKGATFNIYLPRYIEDEKDDETFRLSLVQLETKASNNPTLTVLLVEDEKAILKLTKLMIAREGYNVLAANSPSEAINIAQKHDGKIDLLITDMIMPKMNGYELAKNIISKYPDVKVLFMSGYTADVISGQGRVLSKEVNFIQKPFSKKELSAKLKDILIITDLGEQ
ncbi:MAG: response regulator [Desulfamplus sp.]|nr:response regulator [Desulfamplus sp.]